MAIILRGRASDLDLAITVFWEIRRFLSVMRWQNGSALHYESMSVIDTAHNCSESLFLIRPERDVSSDCKRGRVLLRNCGPTHGIFLVDKSVYQCQGREGVTGVFG